VSVKAVKWALDTPLPPTETLVLVALAERADNNGICFPGMLNTRARTGLSERAIQNATNRLILRGLIDRYGRSHQNGGNRSNQYQLYVGKVPKPINVITPHLVRYGPHVVRGGGRT
jgi:hypothetical protein